MSDNGVAFLASRGRGAGNVLATLDMLGRQAPALDAAPLLPPDAPGPAEAAAFAGKPARPRQRMVISWGRFPGVYQLVLEQSPDWDVVDSWRVSEASLQALAPVLRAILGPDGIKDYTGEFHGLGPEAVSPDAASAATDPRAARGQPAGRATNAGRGRKDRPADSAVDLGGATDGPGGGEPGEAVVPGPATGVPQTKQPGG